MTAKIIKVSLFLVFSYILQASFITGLFFPLNKINIFLPIIIFFLVLYDEKVIFTYTIIFAVFLAGFSSLPVLLSLFVLPISVLILIKIYYRFFTNKSLYSLLFLNAILLILYNLFNTIFYYIYHFYLTKTFAAAINFSLFFSGLVWQLILSGIFVVITFLFVNFLSNKLKTVFLDAKS